MTAFFDAVCCGIQFLSLMILIDRRYVILEQVVLFSFVDVPDGIDLSSLREDVLVDKPQSY